MKPPSILEPIPVHEILNRRFTTLSCGDLPPAFDANSDGPWSIIERLPDVFEAGPGVYRFMAQQADGYIPGRLKRRFYILTLTVELGIPSLTLEELL